MKFAIITISAFLASTCDAFSAPTPFTAAPKVDSNNAMSQYEAALKAAFEQASATSSMPSPTDQQQYLAQQEQVDQLAFVAVEQQPPLESTIESNTALLEQVQEQEQAIDQYETALKAALESSGAAAASSSTTTAPPTIVFGGEAQQQQPQEAAPLVAATAVQEQVQQLDWSSISKDISSRIALAESKIGGELDPAKKGEIVGTVLAGSAVLGTAAINSPLLMGAALGYAGTHVLGGKRGEALAEYSKDALRNAVTFTKSQLNEEKGDISKASARIIEHLQNEALRKAKDMGHAAEKQAHQVSRELSNAPAHLVEEGKKIVKSDDFQKMPTRTFSAVKAFLGSDEVKRARESVVKSIKDGLESEELKAVKDRATRSLKDSMS
jgi:hypothetical protein